MIIAVFTGARTVISYVYDKEIRIGMGKLCYGISNITGNGAVCPVVSAILGAPHDLFLSDIENKTTGLCLMIGRADTIVNGIPAATVNMGK